MAVKHKSDKLRHFFKQGQQQTYDKGDVIITSDNKSDVFFVDSGYVKSYIITDDGSFYTLYLYGPGYIFPLGPTLRMSYGQNPYQLKDDIYFEALTDVAVLQQDNKSLQRFADDNTTVYKQLIAILLDKYEDYLRRVESMTYKHARQRVANQLLALASRFSSESYGQVILDIPLTHQDLAESMGMARETVSRELESLRKESIIEIKDKYLIIRDVESLQGVVTES